MRRAKHRFAVGCCCQESCPTIGFEANVIGTVTRCCNYVTNDFVDDYNTIDNLVSHTTDLRTQLNKCRAVWLGPVGTCSHVWLWSSTQEETISDWIFDGGRVFLAGEFENCLPNAARIKMNTFLANMGSTIEIGGKTCNCGCNSGEWCGTINTSVPFLTNVPCLYHACTAEITGGTWVAKTKSESSFDPNCYVPYPYAAIERIGNGFICVVGDSNIADQQCWYDNCAFYQSFIETPTEQML